MTEHQDRYGHRDSEGEWHMPFQHVHRPPTTPTQVRCQYCGEVFMSSQMSWLHLEYDGGQTCGCWKCPTERCLGCDFGVHIFPTDPAYVDELGRDVTFKDEGGRPAYPKTHSEESAAFAAEPDTPETDTFCPPQQNTEVVCLHCNQKYDSYRIEWRELEQDGKKRGFWCCPIEGCDGKGFGFDIHPTDVNYPDQEDGRFIGGWFNDDGTRMPPPGAED